MTANKLESREEVISYLVKKTNSSYQASFKMTEELEKFGLVKFEAGDNYFLKELRCKTRRTRRILFNA